MTAQHAWPCPARPTAPAVAAALRLAMERYGEHITVSGSVEFKAQVIRAAVDAQLPITLPIRHWKAAAGRGHQGPPSAGQGVPAVGQEPPPHRRHGLRTLGQPRRPAHRGRGPAAGASADPGHRRRRRPRCSSRPGPRRPSWNSARRGYGHRWKPRRRNARRARSAGDDACELSDVRLASELAARSYIAASWLTPMFNKMAGRNVRLRSGTGTAIRRAVSVMAQRRQLPTRQ